MTRSTIEKYIEKKEKSFAPFNDDFKDRFTKNLESCIQDNETYLLSDLDKAWKKARSEHVYEDRGFIVI